MKQFEYLEHMADKKFRAYGTNLEEQFTNAAYAMANILVDPKTVKPVKEFSFECTAKRTESLLYDFLEQFLILIDTESFMLAKIKKLEIKNNRLKATVLGDNYKNYEVPGDIKAITYNDMEITDKYVQVVVDI